LNTTEWTVSVTKEASLYDIQTALRMLALESTIVLTILFISEEQTEKNKEIALQQQALIALR